MPLTSGAATGRSVISGAYTKGVSNLRSPRFQVTADSLDAAAVAAAVAGPTTGAVATFVGLVRDHNAGRRVLWLDYEAFAPLAVKSFERIATEVAAQWPSVDLAIHHRTGRLAIGDASIVIGAASPHRAEAFSACRYAIERVKQIAPIWKHEHFEGGQVWIEGATADPEDEAARQAAMARACS
jgi:molybdopterin synthase catalytic subunit